MEFLRDMGSFFTSLVPGGVKPSETNWGSNISSGYTHADHALRGALPNIGTGGVTPTESGQIRDWFSNEGANMPLHERVSAVRGVGTNDAEIADMVRSGVSPEIAKYIVSNEDDGTTEVSLTNDEMAFVERNSDIEITDSTSLQAALDQIDGKIETGDLESQDPGTAYNYDSLAKSGDMAAANEAVVGANEVFGGMVPEVADVGYDPARANQLGLVNTIREKAQVAEAFGTRLVVGETVAPSESFSGIPTSSISQVDYDNYMNSGAVAPISNDVQSYDVGGKQNYWANKLTESNMWGVGNNPTASEYFGGEVDPNSMWGSLLAPSDENNSNWYRNDVGKYGETVYPQSAGIVTDKQYNPENMYGWEYNPKADGGGEMPQTRYKKWENTLPPGQGDYGPPSFAKRAAGVVDTIGDKVGDPFRWMATGANKVLDTAGDLVSWVPFLGPRVDNALDSLGGGIQGMGKTFDHWTGNLGENLIQNPAQMIKAGYQGLTGNPAARTNALHAGQGMLTGLTDTVNVPFQGITGAIDAGKHLLKDIDINMSMGGSGGGGGGGGGGKKRSAPTSPKGVPLNRIKPNSNASGAGATGRRSGGNSSSIAMGKDGETYDLSKAKASGGHGGRAEYADRYGQAMLAEELKNRGIDTGEKIDNKSAAQRLGMKEPEWFKDLEKIDYTPGGEYNKGAEQTGELEYALEKVLEDRMDESGLMDAFKTPQYA